MAEPAAFAGIPALRRPGKSADAFRTEPPFKLQGSYRNMNKMAEKISAVMTDKELLTLIDDHYLGEAQLLKLVAPFLLDARADGGLGGQVETSAAKASILSIRTRSAWLMSLTARARSTSAA